MRISVHKIRWGCNLNGLVDFVFGRLSAGDVLLFIKSSSIHRLLFGRILCAVRLLGADLQLHDRHFEPKDSVLLGGPKPA
jgi:hypothetical protein